MSRQFEGLTVFVTGGASGIGRSIVEAFLAEGARVAMTYASSAEAAEAMAAAAPAGALLPIKADAASETETEAAVAQALATFGRLDVAVANAGGLLRRSPVVDCSLELWNAALTVNLTSAFLLSRAVLPIMTSAGGGAIVLMSSLAAHDGGGAGATHYATAKGGVVTFTRALAKEVGPQGIRVNAVAPGLIGTQFHDRFSTREGRQAVAERTPLRREGRPEDVASAVLYLASAQAAFVTGEILEINGGLGAF